MAHWNYKADRQDGDGHDETADGVVRARQWLRSEVSKRMHREPLFGMLADLERLASPFFIGIDYDDDRDDVDEIRPY